MTLKTTRRILRQSVSQSHGDSGRGEMLAPKIGRFFSCLTDATATTTKLTPMIQKDSERQKTRDFEHVSEPLLRGVERRRGRKEAGRDKKRAEIIAGVCESERAAY